MTTSIKGKNRPEKLEEEQHFISLLEHAAEGIIILQDGVIKLVNSALTHMSGYDKEELLGMPFTKILTPKSQELSFKRYQDRLAGKKVPQIYELQAATKDGKVRDIEINAALTEYEGRVADEVIIRDITERKRVEEKLRESEEKFSKVFSSSGNAICITSLKSNKFIEVNESFTRFTGYTRKEVIGRSAVDLDLWMKKEELERWLKALQEKGKVHNEEFLSRRKSGETRVGLASAETINIRGEPCRITVIADITERKKAEEALQQSEKKYKNLAGATSDMIWETNETGLFTFVSPRIKDILGYEAGEVAGKVRTLDLTPKKEAQKWLKCFKELNAKKAPFSSFEITHLHKNGNSVLFETSGVPNFDNAGNFKGYIGVNKDITERKQAAEALQAEKNKIQSVINAMEDGLTIQDKDYNITYQNDVLKSIWGDHLGKKCYRVYEGREEICDGCPMEKAFKDGKSHTSERKVVSPSGEVTFWENTASPIRDANGKVVSCLEITRNITERKKAEATLADEATRRRILVDQSRDGIVVLDQNGKVYEANQQFAEMLGYSSEEVRKLSVLDWEYLYPPEETLDMIRTVDEAGAHFETKHRRKYGSVYDVEISTNAATFAGQKLIFCVCRDITERKRTEEALRESEERYRAVIEGAHDMIQSVAIDGSINFVNQAWLDTLGYTKADLASLNLAKVIHPDSLAHCQELFAKVVEGEPTNNVQATFLTKDGREILVEGNAAPRYIGDKVVATQGIFRDITERKQMEAKIRVFSNAIAGAVDAIAITNTQGIITYANSAMEKTYGYEEGELLGKSVTILTATPEIANELMTEMIKKGSWEGEIEAIKKNKEPFPASLSLSTVRDDKGNIMALMGALRDITERKNMEKQLQEKNEELDAQNEELKAINEELQATEEELQHSQERLERMFESVTDGIVVTTLAGTVLKVNERAAQMIGYASADELLGKSCFDCVVPIDRQKMADNMQRVIKEGLIKRQAYTLRKADGTEFPAELSTNIIKDASGNAIGLITIARDITERKQMEDLFKTVTESSPVGIYIFQSGKFLMANPHFQQLTGYTAEELNGMNPLELVVPEDRDMVRKKAVEMLKGERSSPYQFRVINKSGETRWVMETVTSIKYRGKRATLGNYMDITERKQVEERQRQLEQELNLASRLASIGQLAAGVAHEINNPLTGVIGFSHLMMSQDIPKDMKQDLQVINSEAQRVAKIVENLLVFAHQRKTGREYAAINDIITKVMELRAYEMKVNNIEVENQLDPDLPFTMADTGQLQQVFLNIVLNAEYSMSKARRKGKLLVRTEKINGKIRAYFTDNGTGISKENLDKIFNPFFTTKEVGKGTGLGLSICHGIITQHQGRIYAESEAGKWATFVVELPIVTMPAQADKPRETQKESPKPRGAKILVVDDEEAILAFLSRLLTEWGHSVETINNADDALEHLKTERYSLVLLDIKLPGMSGIELYRHIEEIAPALARRVMFITGDVMEDATRDFLGKSNVPHITKPLDIEVLKKTINSSLNRTQIAAKQSE